MGYLVGGVNLYGEILTGINELDEQGELIAKALVVFLADELLFLFPYQLVEALALVRSRRHDGLVVFHAGDLPTLSHILYFSTKVFEGDNLVASPERLFQ